MSKYKFILNEDAPVFGGDSSKNDREERRVIKALRIAAEARKAAKLAREKGNDLLAADLEAEAQALEDWANKAGKYQNNKNDTQSSANNSGNTDTKSDSDSKDNSLNDDDDAESDEENENDDLDFDNDEFEDEENDDNSDEDSEDLDDEDISDNEGSSSTDTNNEESDTDDDFDDDEDSASENQESDEDEEESNNENQKDDSKEPDDDKEFEGDGEESDDEDDQSDDKNEKSDDTESEDEDTGESAGGGDQSSTEDDDQSKKTQGNSDNEDDEEEEDAEDITDDSTFKNPFEETPRRANQAEKNKKVNPNKQEAQTREEKIEAMKQVLAMLRKGEKDGAKKAFNDLLTPKTESLHEAIAPSKSIRDVDDDEYNEIINTVLDKINVVNPVSYIDDKETRTAKIDQIMQDPETARKLKQDDFNNQRKDRKAKTAKEKEIQRYKSSSISNLPGSDALRQDIENAVAEQISTHEEDDDSWGALNRRFAGTSVLKPGKVVDDKYSFDKPLISVYLDCSGSFSFNDIEKERQLLAQLAQWQSEDKIEVEIWYFADHIHKDFDSARMEGGTSAWPQIIEQIYNDNPANVLIVTDSDMNYDAGYANKYFKVDGIVWYLWKKSKAENLPIYLRGNIATRQYRLDW